MTTTEQPKKKKAILVTGGNTGIGFALCKQLLLEDNCHVYLGARNMERGRKAVADIQQMCVRNDSENKVQDIEFVLIDVSDDTSVQEAATTLKSKLGSSSLYGLVNNAGVGIKTGSGCVDELLATNFYGPKRVTDAVVGMMLDQEQGSRIVNVSSGLASVYLRDQSLEVKKFFTNPQTTWDELVSEVEQRKTEGGSSGGMGVYGLSKAALNLITIQQAKLYAPPIYNSGNNIVCASISPGFVATNLTSGLQAKLSPEEGTVSIRHCLFSSEIVSGCYYGSDGLRSPLTIGRDPGTPSYEGEEEATIDRHKNKYNN